VDMDVAQKKQQFKTQAFFTNSEFDNIKIQVLNQFCTSVHAFLA
jgi:hypothetical protein